MKINGGMTLLFIPHIVTILKHIQSQSLACGKIVDDMQPFIPLVCSFLF